MITPSRKHRALWLIAIPVIYLIGFLPLWLGGGYVPAASGEVTSFSCFPTGAPASDFAEWQPLAGSFQPGFQSPGGARVSPRCDWIGWTWYPLLSRVQSRHLPVRILKDRGFLADPLVLPPNFRVHPLRGGDLARLLGSAPAAGK